VDHVGSRDSELAVNFPKRRDSAAASLGGEVERVQPRTLHTASE